MPENNNMGNGNNGGNNNFNNDLPKLNNNIDSSSQSNMVNSVNNNVNTFNSEMGSGQSPSGITKDGPKNIIEIPQEYYDKIAKEQQDKLDQERKIQEERMATEEGLSTTGNLFVIVIFNAIVFFCLFYLTHNVFNWAILGVPLFIVVMSIFSALTEKEKSAYPQTVLTGGMFVAVITFVISMFDEAHDDMWIWYTIASAVTGIIGMMTSSILTTLFGNIKSVTALKAIGYVLYFGALIGVPIYLEKNYHEEFYKYLFNEQVEVKAENETDFVLKQLKQRYNMEFTCGLYLNKEDKANKRLTEGKYESQLDQFNHKVTSRICQDGKGNEITVQSRVYNESENQYIIIDNYIDNVLLVKAKNNISESIKKVTNASSVVFYMYPKTNCTFYGDCVDVADYFARYDEETSVEKQYKVSKDLNLSKEILMPASDYINNHEFKYVLNIKGNFNDINADYSGIIMSVLNTLNSSGYKNTYGYEITLLAEQQSSSGNTEKEVYKVVGQTNNDKTFSNPEVVDLNANK